MAISNVLAPRVHRMVASNTPTRELGRLMTRAGRLQFIMLMCVFLGFVAVGRPFVVLWAKGDASFAIDYPVAILLFLSTIMSSIQFVGLEILRAKGMHKFRAWVYLAAAGVNVVLMIPCAGSGVCWRRRQHPYRHTAGKRHAHQLVLLQKDRAGCETVLAAHRPAAALHAITGHCGGADRPLRSGGQLSADRSVGLRVRGRLCRKSVDLRHEPLRAGTGQQ